MNEVRPMQERVSGKSFLNENTMKAACAASVLCTLASLGLLTFFRELTLLTLFQDIVKIVTTIVLYWAFSRFHWDVARGMMGGVLFCLLYQESFLVLGSLWGETVDFDAYLIMGVEGSLYLAAQSMSFLMTIIITINHFIIAYSHLGSQRNVLFNQLTIWFKVALYLSLIVINRFIDLPVHQLVQAVLAYITDLSIVVILICIESQLDNFKSLRQELLQEKRKRGAAV